jgi:hypothetical protein
LIGYLYTPFAQRSTSTLANYIDLLLAQFNGFASA